MWTGTRAKELGLVDEIGGLDAAVAEARKLAKLDENAGLEVYPPAPTLRDVLAGWGQVHAPFGVQSMLMSELRSARELVDQARAAEQAGFDLAVISDHFHPWLPEHDHSPFAWSVLGAIAQALPTMGLATGVTCPTGRYHPAVVAQAAATVATLSERRFTLGVGSGERLNEHVTGQPWPRAGDRRAMVAEAIDIIRRLWEGANVNHRGEWFTVENAQLFGLPDALPPILLSASGRRSAKLAGEQADGLIAVSPDPTLVAAYESVGGQGRRLGQLVSGTFALVLEPGDVEVVTTCGDPVA